MSLIKNLIKEPESKPHRPKKGDDADAEEEQKPRPVIKSATDLQRLKLEKLMKNPQKPVIIPEPRREKDYMQTVPSFVRNVMGSSAGAGSGEFHVYRHLRRKEYARQKTIQAKSVKEQLDDDYQLKLEENRLAAEEKTAKKRAKRMKKKQRGKKPKRGGDEGAKRQQDTEAKSEADSSESDDDDNAAETAPQACKESEEADDGAKTSDSKVESKNDEEMNAGVEAEDGTEAIAKESSQEANKTGDENCEKAASVETAEE